MESRPYFVIGDLLVNAAAGSLVALVCTLVLSSSWPPVVAMMAGMIIGSLMGMILAMATSVALGAFEVMLPVMTTGMLAGMLAATRAAPPALAAAGGALVGVGVLVVTYALNARLRREGGTWTS